MKKANAKKWIILAVIAVVVAVAVTLAVMAVKKSKQEEERVQAVENIKGLVQDIFPYSFPDEDELPQIKDEVKTVLDTPWMEEEFRTQAVAAIQKLDFDSNYGPTMQCFRIKQQQILLEEVGYESPEIKSAYEEMLRLKFEQVGGTLRIAEVAEDVLSGPTDEEEIYNKTLSYYRDPQSIFLEDYLPGYFDKNKNETSTEILLNVCNTAGIVGQYADVSGLVDLNAVLATLTADADQITVKEGEGYYADKTDAADTDFKYEEYGPGDFVNAEHRSEEYYGDLAYIFTSNDRGYRDDEGNYTHGANNVHREVYLKGERISWDGLNETFIEYASEDGMVSYHKDGYCYAISDNAITCFVGGAFYFEFSEK